MHEKSSARSMLITKETSFFQELNILLIVLHSFGLAAELMIRGTANFQPGDYLTVEAKHLGHGVRVPLYGPVQAALQDRKPDCIHIIVDARPTSIPAGFQTSGFTAFTDAIFLPFLVGFFERTRSELSKKFSTDRTKWPPAWQMAWALRNAASHGGTVFERINQVPVTWRGLVFSPTDEPRISLLNILNGGDILLLMRDMEESLSGTVMKEA